jgi:hypothetical protein
MAMLGLFFSQLVLAYLAMLLAMSFAVPIFVVVLLGLTTGHWLFNFKETPKSNEACCGVNEANEPLLETHTLGRSTLVVTDDHGSCCDRPRAIE